MQVSHELIVPETGFPFKLFIFEGSGGNYYRRDTGTDRSRSSRCVPENRLPYLDDRSWTDAGLVSDP